MKIKVFSLFLFAGLALSAWQIDSTYRIVLPEKPYDGSVARALEAGAGALQSTLAERGISVPVVKAVEPESGRKSIFIGFPDGRKYDHFDGSIRISGRDIYLTGNDRHGRGDKGDRNTWQAYYLGSVKALTVFMERWQNVRFVLPGPKGFPTLPGTLPELPEELDFAVRPQLQFSTGRYSDMLYDYANNNFGRGSIHVYGGHSYYTAVPREKYAASHPEYFSVLDGRRAADVKYYSHCISNPEVQELIYAEMLRPLDAGAETVELAQTDGYRPCECEKCQALFGVSDPGEKLWILHRNFAERLLKDRPGKKVLIIAYNPTVEPPKTFTRFPANTMVELCHYTEEDFAKWRNHIVPGGFVVYIYNWGYYQVNGLTPKFSANMAADQVRRFQKNNVLGVYRCGFGELFGLEGAVYYIYGKMFDDPSANPAKLRTEYCLAAYGPAASGAMNNFFRTIDERIDSTPTAFHGVPTGVATDPMLLLPALWTPKVLESLESSLRQAEQSTETPAQKQRVELVRLQFDYLKNLVSTIYFYNAYKLAPSFELLNPLLKLVEARNALIASCFDGTQMKRFPDYPGIPRFGIPKKEFMYNGRMYAILSAPFSWNVEAIREKKVLPGVTGKSMSVQSISEAPDMDFSDGAWKAIPWEKLEEIQLKPLQTQSRFKIARGDRNLYLAVESDLPAARRYNPVGRDGKCWEFDCIEVVIDPWGTREKYFHFIANPIENSCYESAVGLIEDPLHPLFRGTDVSWNGKWSYRTERKGDRWLILFTLPFETLGKTPEKGDAWTFNVCREAFPEQTRITVPPELSCWSPCFEALSFHERSTFGELRFN